MHHYGGVQVCNKYKLNLKFDVFIIVFSIKKAKNTDTDKINVEGTSDI